MIRLVCPVDHCAEPTIEDDTDTVGLAATMTKHLLEHGFPGSQLIRQIEAVLFIGDPPPDMLRTIDQALIAEDIAPPHRRHAVGPGLVTIDGYGAALCKAHRTVRVVHGVSGGPLRATPRAEPGVVVPQCVPCRQRLRAPF